MTDWLSILKSSQRQHPGHIETVFHGPLSLFRQHVGPFALKMCYRQMEDSMYYSTEILQCPSGVKTWVQNYNSVILMC